MSEIVVYPSAARTGTPAPVDIAVDQQNATALLLLIDVTAVGVTPSVVPTIDGVDVLSGKLFNLLTGTALTAVVTRRLSVAPGLVVAANLVANEHLPDRVRVTMTHGNGVTITYSVSAHLIQ
jgi:hypothetical protein